MNDPCERAIAGFGERGQEPRMMIQVSRAHWMVTELAMAAVFRAIPDPPTVA